MTKEDKKILEKAYEWVYVNAPKHLQNDGFIIGVYNTMKKEVEKENVRLEKAKQYFNKNYTKKNSFEVLNFIFNEIFEGEPNKQENRWLRKIEKETGLKEQWELEAIFQATECF